MHLVNSLSFFSLLATSLTEATPAKKPSGFMLHHRKSIPQLGPGIDVNDPRRGGRLMPRPDMPTSSGAFSNVFQLLGFATTHFKESIFNKYFNPGDRDLVMNLFNRLLDDDHNGAPALRNILVKAGEDDPNNPAPAELEGYDDPDPHLILTDDAWVYPNRDEIKNPCGTWNEEGMTQDMYLLGSILLHEFMHWDWFLGSLHHGKITDQPKGYGWENARNLNKNLAKYNADSYGWYATENFWATLCAEPNGYD
ncbi:hypothetical protein FQN50_009510 [Emmonsiellopsis sp. PD_5]|nr:hypothetical protein FQN50_009510 [Emmonsiellopsis sp. PD_5]